MAVSCVQCVVLWIILSASFGINDAQFCIDHGDNPETPYVKMCTAHSLSIQAGQSIYIDSTFDPKMQKVSCNCTFTLPYTANLQLAYRVRTPLPNECEASFKIDDSTTSWGCVNYSHTFQIPTTGNLSYIKNINTIPDWQSCTKITPMAGASLTVSCFPSRIYYAPEDNVDGVWGQWAAWTQCSVTCAGGTQTRTRQCNNPPRQHNGTLCSTSDGTEMEEESESRTCNDGSCTSPVDGQYSEWTQWNTCTTTCDGGTKTRSRQCNNPAPQNGGSDCTGDASESTTCGTQPCPVDGQYSEWSTWGTCSLTCGQGSQTRSRTCTNPAPQHGGQSCTGVSSQTQTCSSQTCPGSEDNTQSSTQGTGTGTGNEQVDAQKQEPATGASIGGLVGGIIGGLLFVFLVVLLLICFLRRRRKREPEPKTGPRSVRYMSGDDVTVTENELYNYDGENPAHATNALFVGGIPETPTSPGFIPHYSTDTGDRYAVIMDSTRRKQKAKERPSLQSFNSTEKDTATTNGDIRASTDTVKLAENYNEDIPGDGLENPGYGESYLAPYDSPTEHKPKTSSSSSPSPYDYIDHQKLKLDDEEYERENAANDYATLPDERDDAESDYDGRYKRFINKDPIDDASDGYLKSPTRDKTFEYPDLN